MNILFVMDPLDKLHIDGDSTFMMMMESSRRGWSVWWCTPDDLFVVDGTAHAEIQSVVTSLEPIISGLENSACPPHFDCGDREDQRLDMMDIVWMRKDPPFDMDYVFSTYILDLLPASTLVLNDPRSLRNANEKMFALQWAEFCPDTLVTREIGRARKWARNHEQVVIKPWDGNGGRGVLVSHHQDPNFRSMLEILTDNEAQFILVQEYLPEVKSGDKRIILIDGEAVGWMARIPQPGDHRGNMHVGARVDSFELSERDLEICNAIGPELKKLGLLFVGIDIIGSKLTEINVTSPTGIREINRLMGINLERQLADKIIDYLNAI